MAVSVDGGMGGTAAALSRRGRYIVLAAAFLGWMSAGVEMAMYLAARSAIKDFLAQRTTTEQTVISGFRSLQNSGPDSPQPSGETEIEKQVGKYFSWYLCAFLLGAASGGLMFGWLGDHIGRAKTMGLSILCFSLLTGAAYFSTSIEQFIGLRFLACLGIGGMWPTGVSLASEAWSDASRPLLAGLIGTSANVGLASMAVIGGLKDITPDEWRWVMLVGAAPVVLALFVLLFVPESPRWLAHRAARDPEAPKIRTPVTTVFRSPYWPMTVLGILLGAIPLLGGWGSLNWLIPWAGQVGDRLGEPGLKASTQFMRSAGAAIGSLMGGWLASQFGRRTTYFAVSLCSLAISGYIFWALTPESDAFYGWVFVMGFTGTIFFGWLPLYLPELFPTHVRSTGSGVTFNFGRILTALGVLGTGKLVEYFSGDYAMVGRITHLIYAVGMVVILFAPDTSGRRMDD